MTPISIPLGVTLIFNYPDHLTLAGGGVVIL
jgi:hypothetical protein